MDQAQIIKHMRKNLIKYENQVDELTVKLDFQSRILNMIREHLLTRTEWDGVFDEKETLADLVKELIEDGNISPRGSRKIYRSGRPS